MSDPFAADAPFHPSRRRGRWGGVTVAGLAAAIIALTPLRSLAASAPPAPAPTAHGASTAPPHAPVVAVTTTPDGGGYWFVASDGGVFSYNAAFYGSTGGTALAAPSRGSPLRRRGAVTG